MTDTTVAIAPLTADDIAALRAADSVSFHFTAADRGGFIVARLRRYADEPVYTVREQRLYPQTDFNSRSRSISAATRMNGYGGDNGMSYWTLADDDTRATAYASVAVSDEWHTVASLLRPGDTLTLRWLADNNNGYVRDAGLHCDSLSLVVARSTGQPLVFRLVSSAGPDNSARMIRRFG